MNGASWPVDSNGHFGCNAENFKVPKFQRYTYLFYMDNVNIGA